MVDKLTILAHRVIVYPRWGDKLCVNIGCYDALSDIRCVWGNAVTVFAFPRAR